MNYENYTALRVAVDTGVAVVTLDNGPINLMDMAMIGDLDRVGRELAADAAVKVVVVQSANPDFFVAHADLNLIRMLPEQVPPREEKLGTIHAALDHFRRMPKATIAKIEGRCRGGGSELALACDMRFATIGRGIFGQPEVGVGFIPGAGGTVRLPRLIGRGRALEIILGCADLTAEEAERYGYINRALPAGEIDQFVNKLAARIASFPAEAIAMGKEMVDSTDATLENDLVREEAVFLKAANGEGAKRRMSAAMAMGMQTPAMETLCFTDVWGTMADA